MIERSRHKLNKVIHVEPQDMIVCSVQDRDKLIQYSYSETVKRSFDVDTIVTFDLDEPVFGVINGIGAVFGKGV